MAKGRKTGGRDFVPGDPRRGPGGHPKGFEEFRAACREVSPRALGVLVDSLKSEDERIKLEAAKTLLERAWGRPASSPEDLETLEKALETPRELVMEALKRAAERE